MRETSWHWRALPGPHVKLQRTRRAGRPALRPSKAMALAGATEDGPLHGERVSESAPAPSMLCKAPRAYSAGNKMKMPTHSENPPRQSLDAGGREAVCRVHLGEPRANDAQGTGTARATRRSSAPGNARWTRKRRYLPSWKREKERLASRRDAGERGEPRKRNWSLARSRNDRSCHGFTSKEA